MKIYLYDKSLEGFFSAVFDAYKNNSEDINITASNEIQCRLDDEIITVTTDIEKAERIKRSIYKNIKGEGYRAVKYAFASEKENKELIIYRFLLVMFKFGGDAPYMLSNHDIIAFTDLSQSVGLECHRMLGFIRFQECSGGYYAAYEPDSNITEFIMPHFIDRYREMNFIIHDVRRNIIGIFNRKTWKVFQNNGSITVYLTESEQAFLQIWKMYYKTINIAERKNIKQMKRFMPVRYWKNMPEKDDT